MHRLRRRKIRPHIRAAAAARVARELVLDVRQANIVALLISLHHDVLAAVVRAIDQHIAAVQPQWWLSSRHGSIRRAARPIAINLLRLEPIAELVENYDRQRNQ
jgi:hypothetical protein